MINIVINIVITILITVIGCWTLRKHREESGLVACEDENYSSLILVVMAVGNKFKKINVAKDIKY